MRVFLKVSLPFAVELKTETTTVKGANKTQSVTKEAPASTSNAKGGKKGGKK